MDSIHDFPRPVLTTRELISNLCLREGYCWAKNAWLAAERNVSQATITRHIRQLVSAGLFFWKRVGNERHLFPAPPPSQKSVPKVAQKAAPKASKMPSRCVPDDEPMPTPYAGATDQQTQETNVTFGDNKQPQAILTPQCLPACSVNVVVSSAKAQLEDALPQSKPGLQRLAALLPVGSLPEPLARAAAAPEAITQAETAAPEGKAVSPAPPASAPELEIVTRLSRAGMHLRAAEAWAQKQPAECVRLIERLPQVSGVRDKARWLVSALRDAAEGNAWAFVEAPKEKAPPKAATPAEIAQKQQQPHAAQEAAEKAAQGAYEAIPIVEREALQTEVIANLPRITRRQWEAGSRLGREAVRAAVLQYWTELCAA